MSGWQATQEERVELVLQYARTLGFTPTSDQDRRIRQALSERALPRERLHVPVPLLATTEIRQSWTRAQVQRAIRRVLRRWHQRGHKTKRCNLSLPALGPHHPAHYCWEPEGHIGTHTCRCTHQWWGHGQRAEQP